MQQERCFLSMILGRRALSYTSLCLVQMILIFSTDGSLPKVVHSLDTPAPNYSATKITYVFDEKTGVYSPNKCEPIGGDKSEVIDCRDAFN